MIGKRTALLFQLLLFASTMTVLALVNPPDESLFWDGVFDLGHIFLFGIVMWIAVSVLELTLPAVLERRRSAMALIATLAIAATTEALQRFQPTRDPSPGDFLRDAAGAAAFLLFRAEQAGRATRFLPLALRVFAMSALMAAVMPFVFVLDVYFERDRTFPTLLRLDGSYWERRLLSFGNAELTPNGGSLARLTLRPGEYAGLVLDEPYPDWRGFKQLVFTVSSDVDAPIVLHLRIHDRGHNQRYDDRFNKEIMVTRGQHAIAIPIDEIRTAPRGRQMDLSQVRGIVIFVLRLDQPAHIYLGSFRLE